ncbi:PhzF family phenazine biosynthesis protein [Mycobacterium sp. 360MFTsu5.1]|uniref:PhzF family phenazine biosynthesis protein n=1 Tax=Mycobacterium sp. 360MFTsu5.1 TaxID=1172186 RepID=UPI003369CC5A
MFTDRMFAGDPLAVILGARGLTPEQMQAAVHEFNYVESTFRAAARRPRSHPRPRIFTSVREVPFAGSPSNRPPAWSRSTSPSAPISLSAHY